MFVPTGKNKGLAKDGPTEDAWRQELIRLFAARDLYWPQVFVPPRCLCSAALPLLFLCSGTLPLSPCDAATIFAIRLLTYATKL